MNAEPATTPGWYDDPYGRHELRYWNGTAWTADVASGGRRFVDGTMHASRRTASPKLATAAVVLGVVSIALGWVPYVFVVAAVCGVLAIVFGLLRRGSGGVATTGIVLGAVGLATCIAGVVFTRLVNDVIDAYRNPHPHAMTFDRCRVAAGRAEAEGSITNEGRATADYTITVRFVQPGGGDPLRSVTVSVDDVEPGEARRFDAARTVRADDVDCIADVRGPFPFGVQLTFVDDTHAS